jgi:hypothetical protein
MYADNCTDFEMRSILLGVVGSLTPMYTNVMQYFSGTNDSVAGTNRLEWYLVHVHGHLQRGRQTTSQQSNKRLDTYTQSKIDVETAALPDEGALVP